MEKGCTISSKSQIQQTLQTPFWKALAKFFQGKQSL